MELIHTAHVPAGSGPFPTIVALHGFGASAHDFLGVAPILNQALSGDGVLFLCPQGPLPLQVAPGQVGYAWFPLSEGREIDPTALVGARGVLEGFLDDAIEHYPIDPERVILLGFSQGGVMAYDLALGRPDRYHALVALSTWLPDIVLDGLPPDEARARLTTLLIHGTQDPMVAIENGRDSLEKLKNLGIEAAWGEYEMGHEFNQQAMRDLLQWLAAGPLAEGGAG